MNEYAIETLNLTKNYNGLRAVDNLELKVKKGSIFGFLGPNGAGKSTTISMLATILNPSSGTAVIGGYDLIKERKKVKNQ